MVLEVGKFRIKVLEDAVSGESLLPGSRVLPWWEGQGSSLGVSFIRAPHPFLGAVFPRGLTF